VLTVPILEFGISRETFPETGGGGGGGGWWEAVFVG
jgi:hypothetical protein